MWEELLSKHGAYGVWEKMRKLESFKAYYQKYPYDDVVKAFSLDGGDYYDEYASAFPDRVADEVDFERWLTQFPVKERVVAKHLADGCKPRDIAKIYGEKDTNQIRQHKYHIKQKLGRK